MSNLFQIIEGETAILRAKGVYKEAKLATRAGGELYAAHGGGFIRLYADGATSVGSAATLDTLTLGDPLYRDAHGRLSIAPAADRKPLDQTPAFLAVTKE